MRVLNTSILHLLTVILLLTILISTSWTANIKANSDLLRNNNPSGKIPTVRILKQVDQRIADIIAEHVLNFGHNLGIKLAALDPYATSSEIYSPLSLMAVLSFLALGAKGKTYQELSQILGLHSDAEIIRNPNKYHEEFGLMLYDLQGAFLTNTGGANRRSNAKWRFTQSERPSLRPESPITGVSEEYIVKVANALFVQKGYTLNPNYSQVLQAVYDSQLTELDFRTQGREVTKEINSWVNKATFGRISQLLDGEIDSSTNIVLASALYFKAFWETKFFEKVLAEDFYPDGENKPPVKVQMMHNSGIFPFYDAKEYDCRIIGLPYRGNETTMYVIQPNDSSRQKLRSLQNSLDAQKINGMIDNMKRKTAMVAFPKLRFKRRMHMKKLLKTMNVHDIFINGQSDLSLIGRRSQLEFAAAQSITDTVPVSIDSIFRSKPAYQVAFTDLTTNREKRQVFRPSSDPISPALLNLETNRHKIESYTDNIYVDDILHSVDISVDENGTEAAAATGAILLKSGSEVNFRADTPFIILIRHDPTKMPLFYGIINKPEL